MSRSRTTLASTDAAATDAHLASPSTIGRTSRRIGILGVAEQIDRTVDQERVGLGAQLRERTAGGHTQCLGHAPFVALRGAGMSDAPGLAPRADRIEDVLSPRLAQHLRVAQPRRHGPHLDPRPHHGDADGERTGPRATADLVQPGDDVESLGAQPSLVPEVRRADRHRCSHGRASYHGGVSAQGGDEADGSESSGRVPLSPGTMVDVRNRYQGTWVRGFEIAEVTPDGYRIRRMSDGSTLGELFSRDDVRRERRRQGFWWH